MRKELTSGETRILIVKDFSRFSRRNSLGFLELETLRDVEVCIISIDDSIDYLIRDDWILIQFKFFMNEIPGHRCAAVASFGGSHREFSFGQ